MINQLTELMLSKSVIGEEHTIDTENIKVGNILKIRMINFNVTILLPASDLCQDGIRRGGQEAVLDSGHRSQS